MIQILQNLKNGKTELAEVPSPRLKAGHILVETKTSLISVGTERMLLDFGKAGYLEKARQQPDKVRQVLDKIRSDGLLPTIEAVRSKIDLPIPLGYCNVGIVQESRKSISRRLTQTDADFSPADPSTICRSYGAGFAGERKSSLRDKKGENYGIGGDSTSHLHNFSASGFKKGDRVVSNGPHAEVVCVPENLCAKILDNVSDEAATFTVLGAIGLQGIRLANPTLGEKFVVFGAGLIGLLTVQLLRASGCDVLAVDLNEERLALAKTWGAGICNAGSGDPVAAANAWTEGVGVDGVLITASAKTDEILHQAAEMCRKRGRIVLVGVVGLNLRRADFYEKELTFQVSCSYGPGRYDEAYEQKGQDYPIGYVRWTEQRNFEAVLGMMASGRLDVKPLISHRFPFEEAEKAYELIGGNREPYLGIILDYHPQITQTLQEDQKIRSSEDERRKDRDQKSEVGSQGTVRLKQGQEPRAVSQGQPVIGLIGAGNFAKMTLMPALSKTAARIAYVADLNGVSAQHLARKYGAEKAVTDYTDVLKDPEVWAVIIAVGHDLHAQMVCEALEAGKHVLVEKPLCLNQEQLQKIILAADERRLTQTGKDFFSADPAEENISSLARNKSGPDSRNKDLPNSPNSAIRNPQSAMPLLMVGFNRRFSPHTKRIKQVLQGRSEPLAMNMTVNAGIIPPEHWVHDPVRGGGRIIGEACHFIDLMVHLSGSPVRTVSANMMGGWAVIKEDKMSISLGFEDGSVGTVNYFANGSKSYPKEVLEVFNQGRGIRMENFRRTKGYGFRGFRTFKTFRQDKGHQAQFAAFVDLLANGGQPLIPFEEIVNVTLASFAAVTAARETRTIVIAEEYREIVRQRKG
ncbi:MAG: bi-domain-containing oxidoreductase [Pseudomonadota bacterium]